MAIIWLQTSKFSNNLRVLFLIMLLPFIIFLCLWGFFWVFDYYAQDKENLKSNQVLLNKELFSINSEIETKSIEKDFSFISDRKKSFIISIADNRIKLSNAVSDLAYYNRNKSSDNNYRSEISIATSEKLNSEEKLKEESSQYLAVTSKWTEKTNEELLLISYINTEISSIYATRLEEIPTSLEVAWKTLLYVSPIILLWLLIWIFFQKKIIFSFTWASEVKRKEYPELYNIVENLCISRWLPVPKIWIIYDDSMNAFATWWTPKNSHIVFSKGLLDSLSKDEIEAVAWHELTHIINWDVRTMVIINVFIWIIGTIWYMLLWTRSGSGKKNPLKILWLVLYIVSLTILPLINLAISRKKEFLADAWSVELTKNKDAMISALNTISSNAKIASVQGKNSWVASMFIFDPKKESKWILQKIKSIFSTHPSLEARIDMLNKY